MKRKNETNIIPLILAGFFLAAGVAANLLGFVKYAYLVGRVNVAIYPAAVLMLVGVVLVWWTIFKQARQS